ncbi:MAG: hypothetical protein LUJ09_01850 [Firmicutes bacterium]|nr:hypothetical protein [Bacillota bacterium]
MKRRIFTGIFAGLGLLLLILDGKTALSGATEAVWMCLRVVIPSMFPFFLLSILLTGAFGGTGARWLTPIGRLLKIPGGSETIFLTGLLGGYPSGAQATAQAWRAGLLEQDEAERMLGFCSNAGPSFLFGVLSSKFPAGWMLWLLWVIHILSAVAVGAILPGAKQKRRTELPAQPVTLAQAMERALRITANVCGWIVIFRVILAFCTRWFLWLMPDWAQAAFSGGLELANGCVLLGTVENVGLRFLLCSGMLSLGGVCVAMQTASVAKGLRLTWYLCGKGLQCVISLLLAAFAQAVLFPMALRCRISPVLPLVLGAALAFGIGLLQKREKSSSIPGIIGV